ncbi:HD-GYP domain-containing protein [Lucifera butyrica]|nr:HD-GYP domain-containing protein [Lucifera butyrica]
MPSYQVRQYKLEDVAPGMEVGTIISECGKTVLCEGTVLTDNLIAILQNWGITEVPVKEKVINPDETERKKNWIQQQFFSEYEDTVMAIQHCFEQVRFFREVPIMEMQELVEKTVNPLIDTVGVINHLHLVRRWNEYTFHHSVDVGIIAGVLGKWMGYRGVELKDLILSGLLHDIGKTRIPLEILDKPGRLSDQEMTIMKQHAAYGYEMVKDAPQLPMSVRCGILQHHERMDGSGYPHQLCGEQIHHFARIIAVVDIYDAMTSDRVYHEKDNPFTVVEMISNQVFGQLDPFVCTTFLNNVRDYFVGNVVLLSDGRQAEVVYMGPFRASRPVVKTEDGQFMDLEKYKDIAIIKLVTT